MQDSVKSSGSRPGNDQVMVNKQLGCNMTLLIDVFAAMETEDGEISPFHWEIECGKISKSRTPQALS